jgi:hypothetical protein
MPYSRELLMSRDLERYLDDLKRELKECDPAMIQDAVADAEEHLLIAVQQTHMDQPGIDSGTAWSRVTGDYGSPADVATAYRELEERSIPVFRPPTSEPEGHPVRRFFGILADPRAYAALFFMLFSLITGIIYFTWAVTGLSLSLGLLVLIIGLPFFWLFMFSIQGLALVEGRLIESMLGIRMPRRSPNAPRVTGVWNKFKARLTDGRTWTTLLYLILKMPLGVLTFSVFIILLAYALELIALPFIQFVLGQPMIILDDTRIFFPWWSMPILMFAGFLELVIVLHLARFAGRINGNLAKAMLVRS